MHKKIIERAYLLFLLLLPLVYFSKTIDPVLIPRQVFLSFFVCILTLYLLFAKVSLPVLYLKKPVYIAFACYFVFAVVASFSNFTSESHYLLSRQLLLFSFLSATLVLLYNRILTANYLILSCIGFGCIALGSAVVQIVQKTIAGQNLFKKIEIVNGLFANKNLLASILFLSIPFFCMGMQLSKKVRWIAALGLSGSVAVIIIIRTRAVLLATIIFLSILLYFYIKDRFKVRSKIIFLSAFAAFALLFVGYKTLFETSIHNLKSSSVTSEQYFFRIFDGNSFESRTQFWENSFAMFKDHPVFGVGMGNWQVQFPKYGLGKFSRFSIANGTSTLQRPHNDFIHIGCESGMLGLIAYCAVFGIVLYQLTVLIRNALTTAEKWKFIYIFCGITGYIVISFFDFPMERIEHQVLLMLLFAITIYSFYSRHTVVEKAARGNKILLYGMLFIALYSGTVSAFRMKGESETLKIYLSNRDRQWSETLYAANKAESCFYKIDPTSIPIAWYKGTAHFNLNEIDESISDFEDAYQTAPYQLQVINNLATAYLAKGEKEKAVQLFSDALRISPKMEDARLNLAAIYYNEKKFQKAFETIDKMDINSENKKYRPFLTQILIRKINLVLAQRKDLELAKMITTSSSTTEKIIALYFGYKQSHLSFEAFLQRQNTAFK